jgi:hypothetical protein
MERVKSRSDILEQIKFLLLSIKNLHMDRYRLITKEEEDIIIDKLYGLYEYLQEEEEKRFKTQVRN